MAGAADRSEVERADTGDRSPGGDELDLENVNILCEGPSIKWVEPHHLLDGTTIAVNRTIFLAERFPVDIWCTVDEPAHLWAEAEPYMSPGMGFLTTPNYLYEWAELLGKEDGGRGEIQKLTETRYGGHTFPEHDIYAVTKIPFLVDEEGEDLFNDDGRRALAPTIYTALSWLWERNQTSHVRILGADMRGWGTPLKRLTGFDWEPDHYQDVARWKGERAGLALIMRKFRARNCRVERYFPMR